MKKGFTLVELMATILVLGIIILIAVPVISNRVVESRQEQFKEDARTIIKSIEIYMEENDILNLPIDGISLSDMNLNLNSMNGYEGIAIMIDNEVVLETLKKNNLCGYGARLEIAVNDIESGNCNYSTKEVVTEN